MDKLRKKYSDLWQDRQARKRMLVSLAMLFGALVINYLAALYAFERASNPVTDIILSNIPTFDVDWVFVWGPIIFWLIITIRLVMEPRQIAFTMKSVALFVVIRSVFISLTHIGPFPDHAALDSFGASLLSGGVNGHSPFFFVFSSGAYLFFSAHTGLPFLLGLIFWPYREFRTFCLASSGFFAVVVLLGHLHYTIDVASAFFITYTIHHLATRFFHRDRHDFVTVDNISYAQLPS